MEERIWYILLCFISNSQILLPTFSLSTSLRDDTILLHPMSGRASVDSMVRIHRVHQRSVDCPTGFYEPQPAGAARSRSTRSTNKVDSSIVGRSGHRWHPGHRHHGPWRHWHGPRMDGTNKTPTDPVSTLPYVGICVPCSECSQGEFISEPCTSTSNTVCRQCDLAAGTSCISYDENVDLAMTMPPKLKDEGSPVRVTVDLSGNVAPSKPNRKTSPGEDSVNIQKAGRDERNSWYFLSLCALIGLLVFLSLVMGAYLVSVKVTSWWRYQRPVTVRRRGQSFHEETSHQIEFNLSTMPPSRYDDITSRRGISSQATAPRPSEKTLPVHAEGLRPASDPTVVDESFPSTSGYGSKIHVVRLKNTHMDVDKVSSLDSFVLDARGIAKHRFANQYYPKGFSWSGGVNYDDSSVYSSEDDDDIGTGSLPSRSSPVLQTVYAGKGGRCYGRQSDPVRDSCIKDEVHLVQWPHLMRANPLCHSGGRGSSDFQNSSSPVFTTGAEPKSEYFAMAMDEKDIECLSRPLADPLLAQPEGRYNTSCVSCAAEIEVSYSKKHMPLPCQRLASDYGDHADPHGFLRRHHDSASLDTLPRNFSKVCEHRHSLPLQHNTKVDDLYFNNRDHSLTNGQLCSDHQPSEITNLGHSTSVQQSGNEEETESDSELSVHSPLLDKNIHYSSELGAGDTSFHLPQCKPPANHINDAEHGRDIVEETV